MLAVQFHIPFETQLNVEGEDLPRSRSLSPDAFVAVNRSDAELFSDALGVECIAIPNPIASPALVPAEPPRDRGAHAGRSTVVSLSRLSGEKQLDRMMQSFLRATEPEHLRHWRLDIYGEGDERLHLEEWIAQTPGATDRIRLMGWTDQREAVLSAAALLLSTSRFESFGMNVLEAAQHGTPTLAFACSPGITDLTRDLGGVLVDPDDDDAFVARLRQLLSAPEELDRMGRESRTRCEPYTAASVVQRWSRLVRRIGAARDGAEGVR
nr:glycosyltransferase [Microbacterium esteraromaticum]